MKMSLEDVIKEVELVGSPRTKKRYVSQGAKEPLFGNTIKSLKPIAKQLLAQDDTQELAYALYETSNYDLMYLAGMIVDPQVMTKKQWNDWMKKANFYMISDFIVAVSLSETLMAQEVADGWIKSGEELPISGGYSTYVWLLGSQPDDIFDKEKLRTMLDYIEETVHQAPNRAKASMMNFVVNLGISYIPLHQEALEAAKRIGLIEIMDLKQKGSPYNAVETIEKQIEQGRLGFKRRYVRC